MAAWVEAHIKHNNCQRGLKLSKVYLIYICVYRLSKHRRLPHNSMLHILRSLWRWLWIKSHRGYYTQPAQHKPQGKRCIRHQLGYCKSQWWEHMACFHKSSSGQKENTNMLDSWIRINTRYARTNKLGSTPIIIEYRISKVQWDEFIKS